MVSSTVIVGASAAGVATARSLRELDYKGSIILLDRDVQGAYERPPLSKGVLTGTSETSTDITLLSDDTAKSLEISTIYGQSVVSMNGPAITLQNGEIIRADNLVIATGGEAAKLPITGVDSEGVFVLRHFKDAERLRSYIGGHSRIAVVGGGLIGTEVAASLNEIGHEIFWIDAAPRPLVHILPELIAERLIDWHTQSGINLTCNARIAEFTSNDRGQVQAVSFENGSTLPVDAVVLGVGMKPDLSLASAAGLELAHGGILVDEQQRTSVQGVFAAGDVAAVRAEDGTIKRHEHWQAAESQGENVARAIMGIEEIDKRVPWFWSDQGQLHIEMAGEKGKDIVVRKEGEWPIVFELLGEFVSGVASINNPKAVRVGMRLIKSRKIVSPDILADTSVDLREILRS